VARVQITPESFELVQYDSGRIAQLSEELASVIGFPAEVPIEIDIDEELPLPLTGSSVDIVDGRAVLWFSGANFEDGKWRTQFDESVARSELAISLLRAADRLGPGFQGAPDDDELSDAARHAWDVWAEGRASRHGQPARQVRRHYHFRLYNGFTDVADTAFDRLWNAGELTWRDLETIVAECAAADPRPKPKQRLSRRKETLKAPADA
jgi:hypothetical protein